MEYNDEAILSPDDFSTIAKAYSKSLKEHGFYFSKKENILTDFSSHTQEAQTLCDNLYSVQQNILTLYKNYNRNKKIRENAKSFLEKINSIQKILPLPTSNEIKTKKASQATIRSLCDNSTMRILDNIVCSIKILDNSYSKEIIDFISESTSLAIEINKLKYLPINTNFFKLF